MTETERKEKALTFYRSTQPLMLNLYARWQDEKEYEDIGDYGTVLAKEVVKIGGTFLKMTKRPWGFTAQIGDATYCYSMNRSSYAYKRIA